MKTRLICHRPPLSFTQKRNWRKHLEAIVVTTRAHRNQDWTVSAVVWLVAQEVANAGSLDNSASLWKMTQAQFVPEFTKKKKCWMSFEPRYNLVPSQSRICMVNIKDFIQFVVCCLIK